MSDGFADNSSRLDNLEVRIAYQDRIIAELNDIITTQWRKIDALERQLAKLHDAIQNISAPRELPERPPPHY